MNKKYTVRGTDGKPVLALGTIFTNEDQTEFHILTKVDEYLGIVNLSTGYFKKITIPVEEMLELSKLKIYEGMFLTIYQY